MALMAPRSTWKPPVEDEVVTLRKRLKELGWNSYPVDKCVKYSTSRGFSVEDLLPGYREWALEGARAELGEFVVKHAARFSSVKDKFDGAEIERVHYTVRCIIDDQPEKPVAEATS